MRKYPSIKGPGNKKFREHKLEPLLTYHRDAKDCTYVIQEKIHGSNFRIEVDGNEVKYGSRNRELSPDDSFFGWQDIMEKYKGFVNEVKRFSTNFDIKVTLYGELYGPGIQKGVDYGDEKKFVVFDLDFDDELQSPITLEDFLLFDVNAPEEMLIPTYCYVDGIDEALDFEVEGLESKLGSGQAEGVVVKPYRYVFEDGKGDPFYAKIKSEKFNENKRKPKKCKQKEVKPSRLLPYVTEERVQSVFSKHGEIEERSQIGKYIKLVLEDAKEAWFDDHDEPLESYDISPCGNVIAHFLLKVV